MSSSARDRRLPFAWRVHAWYAAVFLVSLAALMVAAERIAGSLLEDDDRRAIEQELARRQHEHARGASSTAGARPCARDSAWLVRVETSRRSAVLATPEAEPPPRGSITWTRTIEHGISTTWAIADMPAPVEGSLAVGMSDAPRTAAVRHLRTALWVVMGGGLLLALLGGAWIAARANAPVRDLAETTRRVIASGDLTARVPTRRGRDQLDELGALFNQLLERNHALLQGMRDALDNVAHDLRTPLTRLRATAEIAHRHAPTVAERERLADVLEECDRVLVMLTTLMDVSEAESGVMRVARDVFEAEPLLEEVRELYELVAEEASVSLLVEPSAGAPIRGDRARIRQVIANLVDNAIKYTPAGGAVRMRAERAGSEVVVSIRDTGMGIAEVDRERIWDRLYRGDRSRSQRGLGLGLSVVRAIVHAHGGSVEVESEVDRGSTFRVRLPAA